MRTPDSFCSSSRSAFSSLFHIHFFNGVVQKPLIPENGLKYSLLFAERNRNVHQLYVFSSLSVSVMFQFV